MFRNFEAYRKGAFAGAILFIIGSCIIFSLNMSWRKLSAWSDHEKFSRGLFLLSKLGWLMFSIAAAVQYANRDSNSSETLIISGPILIAVGVASLVLKLLSLFLQKRIFIISMYAAIVMEVGSSGATFLFGCIHLLKDGNPSETVTLIIAGCFIQFSALSLYVGHKSYVYDDVDISAVRKEKIESLQVLASDLKDYWLFEPQNRPSFISFLVASLFMAVGTLIFIVQTGMAESSIESINIFIISALISFAIVPSYFIKWPVFRIGGIASGLVALSQSGWIVFNQVKLAESHHEINEYQYSQAVALIVGTIFYVLGISTLVCVSVVRFNRLTDLKGTRNAAFLSLLLVVSGWIIYTVGAVLHGPDDLFYALTIGFGLVPIVFIVIDLIKAFLWSRLCGILSCLVSIMFNGLVSGIIFSSSDWNGGDVISAVGGILSLIACSFFVLLIGIHEQRRLLTKQNTKSSKEQPVDTTELDEAAETVKKLNLLSQENLAGSTSAHKESANQDFIVAEPLEELQADAAPQIVTDEQNGDENPNINLDREAGTPKKWRANIRSAFRTSSSIKGISLPFRRKKNRPQADAIVESQANEDDEGGDADVVDSQHGASPSLVPTPIKVENGEPPVRRHLASIAAQEASKEEDEILQLSADTPPLQEGSVEKHSGAPRGTETKRRSEFESRRFVVALPGAVSEPSRFLEQSSDYSSKFQSQRINSQELLSSSRSTTPLSQSGPTNRSQPLLEDPRKAFRPQSSSPSGFMPTSGLPHTSETKSPLMQKSAYSPSSKPPNTFTTKSHSMLDSSSSSALPRLTDSGKTQDSRMSQPISFSAASPRPAVVRSNATPKTFSYPQSTPATMSPRPPTSVALKEVAYSRPRINSQPILSMSSATGASTPPMTESGRDTSKLSGSSQPMLSIPKVPSPQNSSEKGNSYHSQPAASRSLASRIRKELKDDSPYMEYSRDAMSREHTATDEEGAKEGDLAPENGQRLDVMGDSRASHWLKRSEESMDMQDL